jgi:hypothetical protein
MSYCVFSPKGSHTSDSSLATAKKISPPANLGANQLLIQALTQNVRFTLDNTTPTATVGFQLKAGDPATLIPLGAGVVVRVIEETASATIQYQWGIGV